MPMPRLERTYGCSMLLLWLVVALSRGQAAGADSGWNESNSSRIAACEPKSCGVGPNVSYPFWIHGVHPNYCGMRLFNVSCGGGFPVLPIWGENYTVYNISYDLQTVDLGKPVPEGNISCEAFPNRSFTFDRTPFVLSNSTNTRLLFFFDCNNLTRLPSSTFSWRTGSPGSLLRLPCHQEEGEAELGSFVRYSLWPQLPAVLDLEELMRVCPPVTLPVRPIPAAWDIIPDYNKLLDYRITLKWIAPDCTECRRSGGCCGTDFKETGYSFICICGDGDHRVSCDGPPEKSTKNKNKNWKIIVAAVAAPSALVVVLMLVLIFYRRRYETKRSGSLSKLMRSASSESYSTEKDVEGLSSLTHKFTYGELEEATEGFKESNELGDGGFGTVYKGKLRDGRVVAVKRLYENNFKRAEQFINEVAILNRLRHKNLVSLYGCTSRHSRGLLLVYEYVPNGTVADHLHGPRVEEGALTWPVRMSIAMETAGALAYLHAVEPPIIHRDIKTNNILLDENFHVKVADFGLSRLFPPDATHVSTVPQGTPGYLDPEYHQCYQLTDKSDVYSFGVVLAELISSKPAVDISRKRNEINLANLAISRIQNCRLQELVDPLLGYDSDDVVRNMIGQVAELAFRCLQAEKEMRPSMEEVVEVLKGITGATGPGREHSRGKVERDVKKNTEDCSLLNDSVQYSPDTVHEQWVSTKTTPNTSGQASM